MADRPLCPANDGTRTCFKPAMRGDDTVVKATAVAPTNRDIENQVIYGATYKVHATNLDPKKKTYNLLLSVRLKAFSNLSPPRPSSSHASA